MKKSLQNLVVAAVGAYCAIYLLNPSFGVVEFVPDNFPLIGNLDEAAAVLLLLRCLGHFGLDLSFLTRFGRPSQNNERPEPPTNARREKVPRKEAVIDV